MNLLNFQTHNKASTNYGWIKTHETGEACMESINDMLSSQVCQLAHSHVSASAIYNLRHELTAIHALSLDEALTKNIDFTLTLLGDMPVAFWDMDSLGTQVFNALVSNAIHATPDGGKVTLFAEKQDNYTMVFRISDTGSGMPAAAVRASLFPRLQHNGISSGLSEALACIAAHQGTLQLLRSETTGTVLEFKLPLYALCMQ